jgi:hypothetical protein
MANWLFGLLIWLVLAGMVSMAIFMIVIFDEFYKNLNDKDGNGQSSTD